MTHTIVRGHAGFIGGLGIGAGFVNRYQLDKGVLRLLMGINFSMLFVGRDNVSHTGDENWQPNHNVLPDFRVLLGVGIEWETP